MDKPANGLAGEHKPSFRAVIAGHGSFAPEGILTNDELAKTINTSNEWITTRTGIDTRHIASETETTAHLATEAAKIALKEAKVRPSEIDLIVVATITPEMVFPSTASFVQKAIGARNAWCFDIAAACSGFVYGLTIIQQFLENGKYDKALLIGAETLTKITDWSDRKSCILFGDGAGAVVLERSDDSRRGVIYSTLFSDGTHWKALSCQAYGSRFPADKPLKDPNMVYMEIHGRQVYQLAVRRIVETVSDCLEHCDLTLDDIAMVVPHQMNARIIESAAKRLQLPEEKVFININEYANTSAASVPIAFDQCVRAGRIKQGDVIIFVAFGAGLTWGASIVEL